MEATNGHTPGPWKQRQVTGTLDINIFSKEHERIIAVLPRRHAKSGADAERVANARLITQAPTLLAQRDALAAALNRLANELEAKARGVPDSGPHWRNFANARARDARAALASLEGAGSPAPEVK